MTTKLTHSAQEVLQNAQAEAVRREHQELQPEHVLFALLSPPNEEKAIVINVLNILGVEGGAIRTKLLKLLELAPHVSGGNGQIYAGPLLNKSLVLAETEAKKMGDEYVSGEHFLVAFLSPQLSASVVGKLLAQIQKSD